MGAFYPTLLWTRLFEVGYKTHPRGSHWPAHYQRRATEYNLVTKGRLRIRHQTFCKGDLFLVPPGHVVRPQFLTECEVLVVKVPSDPSDKVQC